MRIVLEEKELRNKIFNLEEVKTRLDAESRGPY